MVQSPAQVWARLQKLVSGRKRYRLVDKYSWAGELGRFLFNDHRYL